MNHVSDSTMDHLPRPSDGTTESLEVPFVARAEYEYKATDIRDFKSFPKRHGFDLEHGEAPKDLASLVQSWLYFGLLAEFCLTPIDISAFLVQKSSEDGRTRVIISSRLGLRRLDLPMYPLKDRNYMIPDYNEVYNDDSDDEIDRSNTGYNPYEFAQRQSDRSDKEGKEKEKVEMEQIRPEYERRSRLLAYVESQCNLLDKIGGEHSDSPLPKVLLSVRVLLETLWVACMGLPAAVSPLGSRVQGTELTVAAVRRQMLARNWCPFQIDYVLSSFPPSLVCYLSQMRRRYRREVTHATCSDVACVAFNIDLWKYEPRHTRSGCSCRFVSTPIEEVRAILSDKDVPLVYLRSSYDGSLSLGVKAAKEKRKYVAYSHVWSDGLGNVLSNAIPECQLRRLADYTFRYGTKYFWLDTLCIPLRRDDDDERFVELRRMAIRTISFIFASASRVIVLDGEIRDTVLLADLSNRTEIMARVLFSSWAGRCWTLEEGALSRNCRIQCIDGEYDPRAMPDDHGGWKKIVKAGTLRKGACTTNNDIKTPSERARSFEARIARMVNVPLELDLKKMFPTKWENPFAELMSGRYDLEGTDIRRGLGFGYNMEHFKSFWNTLAKRQTSCASDRLMILSNLLDLNINLFGESALPMMSLLKSVDGVPLGLFYDPEAGFEEESYEEPHLEQGGVTATAESTSTSESFKRWLPRYPGVYQLNSSDAMRWEGDLLVLAQPSNTELFAIVDVTDSYVPGDNILEFISPQGDASTEDRPVYKYHVEFIRSHRRHRPLPKSKGKVMCLLVDRDDLRRRRRFSSSFEVQGALFRGEEGPLLATNTKKVGGSKEEDENSGSMGRDQKGKNADPEGQESEEAQNASSQPKAPRQTFDVEYDCPVRIIITPLELDPGDGHVGRKYAAVPSWQLNLRYDCPGSISPIPRRYGYGTVMILSYVPRFLIQLFLRICSSSSMVLFMYLSHRAFSKRYSKSLGLRGLVLLFWVSCLPFHHKVLHRDVRQIVIAVAYAAYKNHLDGRLSQLDQFYVVLEIISHCGLMLARELHRRYFKQRVTNEWLRSLRRDSNVDKRELKWTLRGLMGLLMAVRMSFRIRGKQVPDGLKVDPLTMLLVKGPLWTSQVVKMAHEMS